MSFLTLARAVIPPSFRRHVRRTLNKTLAASINPRIAAKWQHDITRLPLTPAHRDLYGIIHRHYWYTLHDFPDLIAPRGFNDRMQWLKLFDQSRDIVERADKIRVKDFVRNTLGAGYTSDILQAGDSFSEINIDHLPDRFVLKTNHDAGSVRIIYKKSSINQAEIANYFDSALSQKFGWDWGEWAYSFIPPKVFAETYIETDDGMPPVDYKFYCSGGRVKFMHFIYGRHTSPREQTIDVDGRDMKQSLYPSFPLGDGFTKPDNWREMIAIAEALSKDLKFVRIDLYRAKKKILVGEMTFWPMQGVYKGDGQRILGQLLDFDLTTVKPFILPELIASHPT